MDELDLLKGFRRNLPGPREETVRALRNDLLRVLAVSGERRLSRRLGRSLRAGRQAGARQAAMRGRVTPAVARVGARWQLAALGAVVVAMAGVGGTYLVMHGAPEGGSASDGALPSSTALGVAAGDRDLLAVFNTDEPLLPGGAQVTLEEAASLVQYPIYRVQDGSVGPPEVWLSETKSEPESTYEVALRYDAELVLTFGRWPEGIDVAGTYRQLAAEWEAGYATTIAGHAAWIVPPDAQAPGSPPVSVVHVTIGDVEITLFGRMPVERLVSLAGGLTRVPTPGETG